MSQHPAVMPAVGSATFGPADIWRSRPDAPAGDPGLLHRPGRRRHGRRHRVVLLAPSYAARGLIEVQPPPVQATPLVGGLENQVPTMLYQQYVETQAQNIKQTHVLQNVIDKLKGEQTMFLGAGAAQQLFLDLEVQSVPNTQLISVRLSGRNKEQVQAIVREVLNEYISQFNSDRDQVDQDRQKGLSEEQAALHKAVNRLASDLARYRDESSLVITDERSSEQLARLVELTRELSSTQVALAEASAIWNTFQELRKAIENGGQSTEQALMAFPEVLEALNHDPSITAMTETVSRYSQELQGLQQRFGDKNETVKNVSKALQAAQTDLESKRSTVLGVLFQQQAALLKSRADRLRGAEAELLNRVAEARTAAISQAKLNAEYRIREDEYRREQTLLGQVNDGLERMRINAALTRANVRIFSPPDIPIDPSEPRRFLYILAIWIFSLLVGFGLSMLLEVADTRVRSPADVARQLGVPLLGNIPDLTEDERLSLDANLGTVGQESPTSLLSEAFRQCRTNLQFASDHPIKSVLVTSPNPGDGKSTVASNLAIAMARSGSRVILVEANFRRPTVATMFDVPDTVGLSNVLVGLNKADEAIQATHVANLDVLVCGALPPSPAELLGSASMRQLVQTLMQRYDQVVIDGAPMLVVADNYLLAEMVDGVVLVFHAGRSTRGMATRAARQVLSLRARLLGGILNRVVATKGGYFREAFQTYYDYSGAACPADLVPVAGKVGAAGQAPPDDIIDLPGGDDPKA